MSPPTFSKLWQQVLLFLLVAAAIISRRPDAISSPQFYAEDGAVWYAQAYNLGWLHSLTIPEGGYLNTLPRVVCGLALLVPLHVAPMILNLVGIVIQALPVSILLSSRCISWGTLPVRALLALIYVALPNSNELDVTITNAQWHLALILCLICFAPPPPTRLWTAFDLAAIILGGLTGPWALVLTPLILIFWCIRRQRWSLVVASLTGICALIQIAVLASSYTRPSTPLGASPELLSRLIAGQIYVAAIWGQNSFVSHGHWLTALLVFVAGTLVLLYCLRHCEWERKLFIVFSILILSASLISPLIAGNLPRWQLLAIDKGARYWFFPMMALFCSLLWCATLAPSKLMRGFCLLTLAASLHGVWRDWHYRPYKEVNFNAHALEFEQSPPGTRMTIQLYPDGHQMQLIKK